jgi:hypothetical protein
VGKAAFASARLGDDITDEACRNPKCKRPTLKMIGMIKAKGKIVECQSCFWRCVTATREGLIFRKGEDYIHEDRV